MLITSCVCVCAPTDASLGFSTYNKKTQRAAKLVSASATPWPAPRRVTTPLSTSPLTLLKVMSPLVAITQVLLLTRYEINKTSNVSFVPSK